MRITEPMTMATDYVLAGLGAWFGWRLLQLGRQRDQRSVRLWGLAFLALAVGALAGGTAHGFALYLGESGGKVVWKLTVYAVGAASFFLLAAAVIAAFRNPLRQWLVGAVAFKLGVYCAWMYSHDDFRYVIYDYLPAMVAVLGLQIWLWLSARAASAGWIVGGVLVSLGAAAVQQSGFTLHRHFNHNDLYHVIQMAGLWLLYRGGRLLHDAG